MMKNVLVLTSTYPLPRHDRQPSFVRSLCHGLSLAGDLRVNVLAPSIKGCSEGESSQNLTVTRYRYFCSKMETLCGGDGILENLKQNRLLFITFPFLLIAQFLSSIKIILRKDIDVVHAHWILPQGIILWWISLCYGRRKSYILTCHGGDLYALNNPLVKWLKKRILASADRITVVSRAMKDYCVQELSVDADSIVVQPMGVDLSETFTPKPSKSPSEFTNVTYVGRLAEKKGVDVLLSAISEIPEPDAVVLNIIGGGGQIDHYKAMASNLGIEDRVIFHGFVQNHDVPDYLREADVAVFPFKVAKDGDQEGLGLTMVEAMGCGCITIATDLPATRDVIDHRANGLLVKANCSDELKDSILEVLQNKVQFSELAEEGRRSVLEKFDWPIVSRKYRDIITSTATK